MNKTFWIACIAIVAIVLSGCVYPPLPPQGEDLTGFTDCTDDEACLLDALENCGKAFADINESNGIMSMKAKLVIYGVEQEKCSIKYTIEEVSIATENEEEKAMAAFMVSMMQGKEMNCLVPLEEMAAVLDLEEKMLDYCSGSLIDAINQFSGLTGE